jgi:hypothetical protein
MLDRPAKVMSLTGELQTRFVRMDVPLDLGPKDEQNAKAEVEAARNF